MDRISALSEVLPYVREFLGKIFVIKIGGGLCHGQHLDQIARQVSLLQHIGMKPVLVHGGSPQMDGLLAALNIPKKKIAGRRITDDATLEAAKMVFAGKLSSDVVSALRAHGAAGLGLSGADAGLIVASRRPQAEVVDSDGQMVCVDFGHVGDIESIQPAIINLLLAEGIIPVVASLGADRKGNALNINADTIASELAQVLKAEKLILLSNVAGVLRDAADPQSLISYIDIETLQAQIQSGSIKDGMLPKISACIAALQHGVKRAHIIDGTRPDSLLLELFMNEGVGTMIVQDAQSA